MNESVRSVEVAVISDVHLGTFGCQADALLQYLRGIQPRTLILNGDIFDGWQFSRRYWPQAHMQVIEHLIKWASDGVRMYYVTGNHDEAMRRFVGARLGSCEIVNQISLPLQGHRAWFFHGDVFDVSMRQSRWIAKMGANGYGFLILANRFVNVFARMMGRQVFLSKSIKNRVKNAVKAKNNFEQLAADVAAARGYRYVVCGHIHKPEIREIATEDGLVIYLNSGDWVEHLTALEYDQGQWRIYHHETGAQQVGDKDKVISLTNVDLFDRMRKEFAI